ncbi:MAG: aryl-sulfate sulfotransferase [Candidatus Hodarchaeota archaeon]
MIILGGLTNRNDTVLILLLMMFILVSPTTITLHRSTPSINQLQTSINASKSQLLSPQERRLQEAAVIKSSNPTNHLASTNRDEVEINLINKGVTFDGYNIFIIRRYSKVDNFVKQQLIVTNMAGEIIKEIDSISFPQNIWKFWTNLTPAVKFINSTTLIYGTDEGVVLWNIYNATAINLGFFSHHELEYNPINNTIFTFQKYTQVIEGKEYRFDSIKEYNTNGQLVWSLNTRSFISHKQWCPYKDLIVNDAGEEVADITHSNSLFFDPEEDVIYYHSRNVNTFYKIDHKTGQVLWGLGEYGNFTLFDRHGNQRKTLFYHAHAVEKMDEDTFILFDNDKHNQTNPENPQSRLLEITINETTMTAHESWSWTAPPAYYCKSLGDADRLPNGNHLGVFGSIWDPNSDIGIRLIEVNETGDIVWELNFENTEKFRYTVGRLERFRLSPILNSPPDIKKTTMDDVMVQWQTWYNFRTTRQMPGSYMLYLDGIPIENGTHVFDKFWRPTNLTFNLGNLNVGDYNLTLVLADEAGHITTDSLNLSITEFYLEREGPLTFELGQKSEFIKWKGGTTYPLLVNITRNNTQLTSFVWNGSVITLDLNEFKVGRYIVSLQLFDKTELIHEDRFLVTIYPAVAPVIHSFPADQSLMWNDSCVLSWELFDHVPASWSIFVNDTIMASGIWETPSYQLYWNVPVLDEGRYNVTFVAYDFASHWIAQTTWLTVYSPSPPIIATGFHPIEIQWGQENASLSFEVHGGTRWKLWKNGTAVYSGEVTSPRIGVLIENWDQEDWRPGTYNLTLQVTDESGAAVTRTSWIVVFVNFGDSYADSVVTEASMWYWDGDNALGSPDGQYTSLYTGYGNGHVTLDMGLDEEILDGKGEDFTVYSLKGKYAVFVSNNLSTQLLVGNQVFSPLILLGEGVGNTSFDLESAGLDQARFIQIVYLTGENVQLDAVMALHYNHPPKPLANSANWKFLVSGVILSLLVLLVVWIRKRK